MVKLSRMTYHCADSESLTLCNVPQVTRKQARITGTCGTLGVRRTNNLPVQHDCKNASEE